MSVSAKINYAVLAVLALAAERETARPLPLREMSRLGIPAQFLAQILQQLKAAGVVQSTRGATGGYRLVASPHEVTVWDVVCAVESPGPVPRTHAGGGLAGAVQSLWQEVSDARQHRLESMTFAEMLRSVEGQAEPMYYI